MFSLKELVKLLKTIDAKVILKHQEQIPHMLGDIGANDNLFWAPVIESIIIITELGNVIKIINVFFFSFYRRKCDITIFTNISRRYL